MTVLGGRVYDVLDSKRSPAADSRVKAAYDKIKSLEAQLAKLEVTKEKKPAAPRKSAAPEKPAAKAKATAKEPAKAPAKKLATKAAPKARAAK